MAALGDDRFLCLVRDLTQQKQMETALAQQAAVLAKEMQAKLEEESLRALRAENDALRAQLLRVAQLALAGGADVAPEAAAREGKTLEESGEAQESTQPAETESAHAVPAPPQTGEGPATPPEPPTPPPTQAAIDPAPSAPDPARESETPANGESPHLGTDAGAGGAPHNSADSPAAGTTTQAKTAVATREAMRPIPNVAADRRQESNTSTNGEPTEEIRPA